MKRRTVLQLDEPSRNNGYSLGDGHRGDTADSESVKELGNGTVPTTGKGDIDNKVANFLAEIDALDPADESDQEAPPDPPFDHGSGDLPRSSFKLGESQQSKRKESTPPPKPGAYSMFVKGDTEFKNRSGVSKTGKQNTVEEWPEEPTTRWQQIQDDSTQYYYYWNMDTNEVTWDMPIDFSAYLLKQKEYEEKVEKGLRDGTLKPENRPKSKSEEKPKQDTESKSTEDTKSKPSKDEKSSSRSSSNRTSSSRSRHRHRRDSSDSEESSSDSSSDSSDRSSSKGSVQGSLVPYRKSLDGSEIDPVTSTSSSKGKESRGEKDNNPRQHKSQSVELPDSTDDKQSKSGPKSEESSSKSKGDADEMDFDIDDIDKELEMALERKRQELLKLEGEGDKKKKEKYEDDKGRKSRDDKDRRKDDHRRGDRRKDERRRRDDDRRRRDERERDERRDKKSANKEKPKDAPPPLPKLSLKDKIRAEVEVKMEKEKRKKKAIEELMAKELERTVGSKGRKRHHRDDFEESRKRRHHDDDYDSHSRLSRDEFDNRRHDDYRRGYDSYDRLAPPPDSYGSSLYDRKDGPLMKPPPPTAEMVAYEAERRQQVVDYGHGRSNDYNGDSDREDRESADRKELKKLEALQLAELALSKLEFLEVTKKGLSKLQILLIELETRHQDWQAGGLTTNHFLSKLREANWQLEQYEESAAPLGWLCHWDRAYRRYYYTHKRTGKTQWDYPDSDDITAEDAAAIAEVGGVDSEMVSSTTSAGHRGMADSTYGQSKKSVPKELLAEVSLLPPPPPPPAEDHPVVKGLQLMYGSTSESESDGEENTKKPKREPTPPPLPPLPPTPSEKTHKAKKKKKSKSRDQISVESVVGPQLPPPSPPSSEPVTGTIQNVHPPLQTSLFDPAAPPPPPPGTEPFFAPQPDPGAALQFGQSSEGIYPHPILPDGSGGTFEGVEYPVSESSFITKGPRLEGSSVSGQASMSSTHGPQMDPGDSGNVAVEESVSMAPTGTEEKKKKKKDKSISSSSKPLKKKHVSSLVQKWQKVKKEVEEEEKNREQREAEIRRKLEEWKQE